MLVGSYKNIASCRSSGAIVVIPAPASIMGAYWFRHYLKRSCSRQWMSRWPLKSPRQNINANTNTVNIEAGMSLAEADAILERFSYVDTESVAFAV